MTPPSAVISEIQLLRLLTPIPGFTMFRSLRLLHGRPPPVFRHAYRVHREGKTAELRAAGADEEAVEREFGFPDPNDDDDDDGGGGGDDADEGGKGDGASGPYSEGQWWALLEMQDAGTDLEGCSVGDVFAVWDVFWRVAIAVGKGEASVGFEHRDLHAGNVCVRMKTGGTAGRKRDAAVKCLGARDGVDLDRTLGFTDLEVTVIDYTNSRAELPEEQARKWGIDGVAYKDLEEELEVFETRPKFGYQYRIPRFMRDLVLKDGDSEAPSLSSEMKKRTVMRREQLSWRDYHPKTNLLWLHFLLTELMDWTKEIRQEAAREISSNSKRNKVGKPSRCFRRLLKESDLENKLLKVGNMLMPQSLLKSTLNSVGDLVEVAWRAGWLNEDDILQ